MLFYPLVGDEDDASKQYLLPLELFSRPSLPGKDSRALRAHAVRAGQDVARFEFGRDGASPGALAELDAVLESFELVKLKTGAGKKNSREHWRRTRWRHFGSARAAVLRRAGRRAYRVVVPPAGRRRRRGSGGARRDPRDGFVARKSVCGFASGLVRAAPRPMRSLVCTC